jgi:hypothetical protein
MDTPTCPFCGEDYVIVRRSCADPPMTEYHCAWCGQAWDRRGADPAVYFFWPPDIDRAFGGKPWGPRLF